MFKKHVSWFGKPWMPEKSIVGYAFEIYALDSSSSLMVTNSTICVNHAFLIGLEISNNGLIYKINLNNFMRNKVLSL